jgi:hypothetical protein
MISKKFNENNKKTNTIENESRTNPHLEGHLISELSYTEILLGRGH